MKTLEQRLAELEMRVMQLEHELKWLKPKCADCSNISEAKWDSSNLTWVWEDPNDRSKED